MSLLRALVLAAAVAIAGCTSVEDIRQLEPVRMGTFGVAYKDLAACMAYQVAPEYAVASAVFDRDKRAILTHAVDVDPRFRLGAWEMTIAQDGSPERSRVELRSNERWAVRLWPVVARCGA